MAAVHATRNILSMLRMKRIAAIPFSYSRISRRNFSFISAVLSGRKYTSDHEWIVNQDGIGTVGVTDYAQDKLGELVYVDMPEVGNDYVAGDAFGTLESVKAASDFLSPVSGTVTEVNENLSDNPSLVNSSPYEDGWIVKIKMNAPEELDSLMSEEDYDKFVREQEGD